MLSDMLYAATSMTIQRDCIFDIYIPRTRKSVRCDVQMRVNSL